MTATIAERALAIGARARPDPDPPREWWSVTPPNEPMRIVYFHPPQTAADVRTLFYPGSGVVRATAQDVPAGPVMAVTKPRQNWPEGTWVELSAVAPWESREAR